MGVRLAPTSLAVARVRRYGAAHDHRAPTHEGHEHEHGPGCGHVAVRHDGHVHGPGCGHEPVPHGAHADYLVDGRLHHPHADHCDDHGTLTRA